MSDQKTIAQPSFSWNAKQITISPLLPATLVLFVALGIVYLKLRQFSYDTFSFVEADGTFVYLLALAFPNLHVPMDLPAYRAQRILLSALASAFGPYTPWAIIGINVFALAAGTYALARIARRYQVPTSLGLIFGLWVGALFVIEMNLTEVLAYALVLWGVLFWEEDRPLLTALLCGLAILAKETTLLYGIAFLLARTTWTWRERLHFGLIALGPGIAWQFVLILTFGDSGLLAARTPGAPAEHLMPLVGLLWANTHAPWAWAVQVGWVLLPALVAIIWGVILLARRQISPVAWALIANGLFIASLPPASTDYLAHSMRIGLAVIVALAWALARTRRPLVVLALVGIGLVPLVFFRVEVFF
jgi:hypothetical protein